MKNIFIHYPNCSTCKNAKNWLEENNFDFIERNIVSEVPDVTELSEWIEISKKEIKKWFNTSGLKYKEMNLKENLINMTDKEKLELLASNGMLIKRPILVAENGVCVGFKKDEWEDILK